MKFKSKGISKSTSIELFRNMLMSRMIEEKMLNLLRLGQISKWFSGIGQEAIAVGCTMALESDETIFPMHRNLGVFTTRGIPLWRLFNQWEGKPSGFTNGRDRSFHFGAPEYNIVGMISHLGPQLSLASGVALAHKLNAEGKVSLAFTGEGGTSQGEFHEALNVAAVWKLPVIFVVENNGYGLSTPVNQQYACEQLADRAKGYGMKSKVIDGNNILEVYKTVSDLAQKMRKKPEPVLVECMTFRMRGHEEASGTKYVPKELMDEWAKKDPIDNYQNHLLEGGVLSEAEINVIRSEFKSYIETQLKQAKTYELTTANTDRELNDVFAEDNSMVFPPVETKTEMRFVDAVKDGLDQALAIHHNLVIMGQDVADYGGVFKVTEGMLEKYGPGRIRNTPLCESAILGIALGMAIKGYKSVVEMQFADFVSCGFNQIVNNLAKVHYRWGQQADVVVRMPTGGGVGAGPFHSQSTEAWFTHVPGLKVVYPSSPQDAKGLIIASIEDPNPVMFFEHKFLYRTVTDDVSTGYFNLPIGKARLVSEGEEASIITYGLGVHWAKKWADENNADVDILDLRSLKPLDYESIEESVKKTNRVLILHEDTLFGGIAGEISAYINESLFEFLDAPVLRCASLDTPVPFNGELENDFMALSRLSDKMEKLLNY